MMLLGAPLTDNQVSPGVLGFVVVALLGVATWLLLRSMNRQLKKIDLPDDGVPTEPPANDGPTVEPTALDHQPGAPGRPDRSSEDG